VEWKPVAIKTETLDDLTCALNYLTKIANRLGMLRLENGDWRDDFTALVGDVIVTFFGRGYDLLWFRNGFIVPVLYGGKLALIKFIVNDAGAWSWGIVPLGNPEADDLLTKMALNDVSIAPRFELEQ